VAHSSPSDGCTPAWRPTRRLLGLLALGLSIHIAFATLLTLSVDEAHYAYYAVRLDWSYFDHPPLVGWIQWPFVALGAPDAILRLIPQGLWLAACLLARRLALDVNTMVPSWNYSRSAKDVAGLWAVALMLCTPLMHVLAVGLLPDTLLMVLTLLIMQSTLRLVIGPHASQTTSLTRWLILGVLLGLAGLSKYTAILPALIVIAVLLRTHGIALLATKGPWLAVAVACLIVTPVFVWNAQHDWVSFAYQLKHGGGGTWQLRRLAAFIGIQIGAYGPLLVLGAYLCLRDIFRQKQWLILGLTLFFIVPFSVTAILSGGGSLPHWTAPAWLAMTPFAANALGAHWASGKQFWIRAFVRAQVVICLAAFTLLFFVGIPGIGQDHPWGKKNPLADMWGWENAGAMAQRLARQHHLPSISVSNWTLASRMAWYAQPLPIFVLDKRFDQFDLWFGEIPTGADSLFVNWSQMRFDLPTQSGGFESCTLLEQLDIKRLGRSISDFSFYHCRNWGATPTPK
jgi:4-amino-4-deoxy-L-arabinose transferase-like glycosyltransferase